MAALTFYFDRNFGRRLPEALGKVLPVGVEYHHHPRHRFARDAPDDLWLSAVGARGWIVFSHDRKFHQIAPELSAIKQHAIGCFYLWGAEAGSWEKLRSFARAYDRIVEAIKHTDRPFIFDVSRPGKLTKLRLS